MIAITFALPVESAGVVGELESKRVIREGNLLVLRGKIAGCEVAISHTGVGRERCRRNIELLLRAIQPQVLISSGFAGSLTDQLAIGELIIAENYSDTGLSQQIGKHGAHFRYVKLLTVEQMVDSADSRADLAKRHSAAAIDMETDVIVEACAPHSIPMLSVRVISDSPAAPFPAPANVLFDLARQKTNFARLIPYVLTHPSAVGRLSRFARQISRARANLTDALVNIVANSPLG